MACTISIPILNFGAQLNDTSLYSATIMRNNSESELECLHKCAVIARKTKSPIWISIEDRPQIIVKPGTYGLTFRIYKSSASWRTSFSILELAGSAFIPLSMLLVERSAQGIVREPTAGRNRRTIGFCYIGIGGIVDGLLSPQPGRDLPVPKTIRDMQALGDRFRAMRQYINERALPLLDIAETLISALTSFLHNDLQNQLKIYPGVEAGATVGHPGEDLLAQMKLQLDYFQSHCTTHVALCDLSPALTQVLVVSVTIMFASATTYLGNTYRSLKQQHLADTMEQCQLEHIQLRMQMIGTVEKTPLTGLEDSLAHELCKHAVNDFVKRGVPDKLVGPYATIIECARGSFAQQLQQGWKKQIDDHLTDPDQSWARVRDVQRRLMAYVARSAGVFPQSLEITTRVEEDSKRESKHIGLRVAGTEKPKEFYLPPDTDHRITPYPTGIATRPAWNIAPASGSQGTVKRGKWWAGAQPRPLSVAIKQVHPTVQKDKLAQLYLEIIAGWTMRHPRIVAIEGITLHLGNISLILPWYENGDSQGYLRRRMTEGGRTRFIREINKLLSQVSEGLAYLRQELIVHGDLSSRNVLIDDNGDAIIADFGLTIFATADSRQNQSSRAGNPRWLAPELHRVKMKDAGSGQSVGNAQRMSTGRPTFESDLFAWAMLSIELYSGLTLFDDASDFEVYERIRDGERPSWPALLEDKRLRQCIKRRWSEDPSARGTANELLQDMRSVYSNS